MLVVQCFTVECSMQECLIHFAQTRWLHQVQHADVEGRCAVSEKGITKHTMCQARLGCELHVCAWRPAWLNRTATYTHCDALDSVAKLYACVYKKSPEQTL